MCVLVALLTSAAITSAAEIHEAAEAGDLARVEALLESDDSLLEARNGNGMTPLIVAAYTGRAAVAEFLIDRGAEVNARTPNGSAPLHGAAYGGHLKCVELLIEHGADATLANNAGYTPFHGAAAGGRIDILAFFLQRGADINHQKHGGETPLILAALGNHHEAAAFLIEKGADLEIRDDYARTPLLLVARETGNADMARRLLDAGADVNARDRYGASSLSLAAWRGFRDLVDLFLDRGAAFQATGREGGALTSMAAEKGLTRLFDLLVEKGADLQVTTETGGTLLHAAAAGGATEIASTLLDQGFDISQVDRYGWAPLHYAAFKGRPEVAAALLDKGADLEQRTLSGKSPFNLAREREKDDVAALLIERGADQSPPHFPVLEGPYLGQELPGREPQVFALDIVSTNEGQHSSVTFSPDGTEAYWSSSFMIAETGYSTGGILGTKLVDGRWTPPAYPSFAPSLEISGDVPFFAPDGQRIFFISRRAGGPNMPAGKERIWYADREGDDWADPKPVGPAVNSMGHHWQFSIAASGALYFSSGDAGGLGQGDIYRAPLVNGEYATPVNLGEPINTPGGESTPYIAPDESYLIFSGSDPSGGRPRHLRISFRDASGAWTPPRPLTGPDGSAASVLCPIVSPDGKYLFVLAHNIYWIEAGFIEEMRAEVVGEKEEGIEG